MNDKFNSNSFWKDNLLKFIDFTQKYNAWQLLPSVNPKNAKDQLQIINKNLNSIFLIEFKQLAFNY